jgi:RimJ/RimL family protein N-acetyltransferase
MITYRRASEADIATIRRLANEIWHDCYRAILSDEQKAYMLEMMYSEKVIRNELQEGIVWEMMVYKGDDVGFISVEEKNQRLKLHKLYLHPDLQGKGFGSQALKHVLDYGASLHVKDVYLNVNKHNANAIRAYERMGFVRTDEGVFDIGGGYVMDDFIYSYSIK